MPQRRSPQRATVFAFGERERHPAFRRLQEFDGRAGTRQILARHSERAAGFVSKSDAIGVWITELPITPEKVLRALERKEAGTAEPRREGKVVEFDEELSVNAVGNGSVRFEL